MQEGMQMKRFSEAYICAIAAAASIKAQEDSTDDDSIDWMLKAGPDVFGNRPQVDVQLKCCKQPNVAGAVTINYRLKRKNYDDLRTTNVGVPRILIVVLVPQDPVDWLHHTEDQLLLRRCGYWLSLRGMPALPHEEQNKKTVNIPRAQQFTPTQLLEILGRINGGGLP
jgi:hypothetical protein